MNLIIEILSYCRAYLASIAQSDSDRTPYVVERTFELNATPVTLVAVPTKAFGLAISNPNATPIHVKFFDKWQPVIGTDIPKYVVTVPASSGIIMPITGKIQMEFDGFAVVAATTGLAVSDTGNPTTAAYLDMKCKYTLPEGELLTDDEGNYLLDTEGNYLTA